MHFRNSFRISDSIHFMHYQSEFHRRDPFQDRPAVRNGGSSSFRYTPPQHAVQLSTLSFTRRSKLIRKIYATVGLMGNDHILSLRTGDALVQCGAPALGRRIYAPEVRRAFWVGEGRLGLRCTR